MACADKEGVGLGAISKEVLKGLDELIDVPALLWAARFVAHELKIFSDLLLAVAEFFRDKRRGNGGIPLLLKLA
jgi:hypothetical protein